MPTITNFGNAKFTGNAKDLKKHIQEAKAIEHYPIAPDHLKHLPPDRLINLFKLFKPRFF